MPAVSHKRLLEPETEAEIVRRRKAGESLREIAEDLKVSRQRIHAVMTRPNPKGKPVTYTCKQCGISWVTTSQYRPERCPPNERGCGSYSWDDESLVTKKKRPRH
ncbi:hypothetical protein K2Z84_21405 [Candidatus Binatia bacterium]|nr:hypothetical protein [Candidatus Binatia bacterium]